VKVVDINVLIGAFRPDSQHHQALATWLEDAVRSREPLGVSEAVLAGYIRIVTQRRIFVDPTPIAIALEQMQRLRDDPGVQVVHPGPSFWTTFTALCATVGAQGNLVADAAHAALAIEHRATFVTLDRDFARFPDLRWESPLAAGQVPS
jgi:toxin-antitoxin system PIN domain toxin